MAELDEADQIGDVFKEDQAKSARNRRACIKRLMNLDTENR